MIRSARSAGMAGLLVFVASVAAAGPIDHELIRNGSFESGLDD
jgi:hypothetical protein